MNRLITLTLFSLLATFTYSAEVLTQDGKVTQVVAFPLSYGSYDTNVRSLLGIYVEGLPKGCGDGQNRVVITTDHPLHDSALSIALMAQASGKEVRVGYFNECTLRSESWNLAYIYVAN
jgi:hypothetical protein